MKIKKGFLNLVAALVLCSGVAVAAGVTLPTLQAAGSLVGTDLIWCRVAASVTPTSDSKCLLSSLLTYFNSGTRTVATGGTGAATLTGLVKGNGTSAMTAAVAGTDYVSPLRNYIAVTSTYSVLTTDEIVDATSGTFTETLPTAVGVAGKEYELKNSGTGVVTVATTSSQVIDGVLTRTLNQFDSINLISDGANWKVKAYIPVPNIPTGGAAYTSSALTGLQDLKRVAQMPNWNKALTRVMHGQGNAHIVCIGDSITQGYNSSGASGAQQDLGWCAQIAANLNANNIPARADAFFGGGLGDRHTTMATNITKSGGWQYSSIAAATTIGGYGIFNTNGGGGNYNVALTNVDTFRFWYLTATGVGNGNLNYGVDGGGTTTIDENVTLSFPPPVTVAAGSLGTHTINFTNGGVGNSWIVGVEGYDSTKSTVIVHNAGWNSSGLANWITSTNPYSPTPACGNIGADLVIINLMVNEERAGTALATYNTNLNTLIAGCQANGTTDVVLMTPNHINPGDATSPVSEATQATYAAQIRTTAAAGRNSPHIAGLPVIDAFAQLVSYNNQVSLGAVYLPGTDVSDLHPNAAGHAIQGRIATAALVPSGIGNYVDSPNSLTIASAGTAYSLTATPAALDFGTTDPVLTFNARGTYRITARARLDYTGATFAASRTTTLKLRRTNNTAADLTGCSATAATGVVTTTTGSFIDQTWTCNYTTRNLDDAVTLFGDVSVVPTAGSIDAAQASISAVRLSQ